MPRLRENRARFFYELGNVENCADEIERLLGDRPLQKNLCAQMKKNVKNRSSEEYSARLYAYINREMKK